MNMTASFKNRYSHLPAAALMWLGWLMQAAVPCQAATPQVAKQQSPVPATFRLAGTLLGVNGKPERKTTVYLVGVNRMDMVSLIEAAERPHYHTVTDDKGHFNFAFRPVLGNEGHYPSDPSGLPWFGEYYVVVPPAADGRHVGVVSQRINNQWVDHDPQYFKNIIPSYIKLREEETRMTLRLARGVSLTGRVLDFDMHPVAGKTLSILLDLHADTHTGMGGAIFERTARTDAQGRFRFDNLYPATQDLSVNAEREPVLNWTRTRVGKKGAWVEDCLDEINLADPASRYVEIMATTKDIYEYRGEVRDEQGQPVAGARLWGGLSNHREQKTYGDYHGHKSATTDGKGQYRLMSPTPWIYGLGASKDGYKEPAPAKYDQLVPPGTHDFVLNTIAPLALNGVLLGVDGRPAAGVELDLILADENHPVDLAEAQRRPHYHVQSDADGRFSFAFLPPTGGGKAAPGDLPGTGNYYVVVAPAADGRHAGVISPLISNDQNKPYFHAYNRPVTGYIKPGDANAAQLTLRLAQGVALEGRVVDDATSQPLTGQTVTLQPEIFFDRPTAYRPALLRRAATTDAQGRYRFDNVAPTTQTLAVEPAKFWTRTRLGGDGPWIDDRADKLNFADAKARQVEIAASSRPHFELRGTVREKTTGKPIVGATVEAYAAWHRQGMKTQDDTFHEKGQTDADGRYRIMVETPWIRHLYAWQHGYKSLDRPVTAMTAPGTYDFELEPASPKAQ